MCWSVEVTGAWLLHVQLEFRHITQQFPHVQTHLPYVSFGKPQDIDSSNRHFYNRTDGSVALQQRLPLTRTERIKYKLYTSAYECSPPFWHCYIKISPKYFSKGHTVPLCPMCTRCPVSLMYTTRIMKILQVPCHHASLRISVSASA